MYSIVRIKAICPSTMVKIVYTFIFKRACESKIEEREKRGKSQRGKSQRGDSQREREKMKESEMR